jgi:uncharacterized membrane protein YgdD (TMEM256/DUF423 family)
MPCDGDYLAVFPSRWAALFALQAVVSVMAGAFGAHALADVFDIKSLGWWDTASQYLMYHSLAGLIVTTLYSYIPSVMSLLILFFAGNVIFAGSLYIMALTGYTFLGAITPLGGLCYLLAWSVLVLRLWLFKKVNNSQN